jgi:preprotein translocase subunit YajC
LASLIVIVAMFALLWLLLIRPQRAKQQQQQHMLESVDVGDEILTSGGIIAVVRGVDDEANELHVEIAPGIEVRMDRRAVGAIVKKDEADEAEEDGADEVDAEEAGRVRLNESEGSVNPSDAEPAAEAVEQNRR